MFVLDGQGRPEILGGPGSRKRSEHGLGHLLPPVTDRSSDWYDEWWQLILDMELGLDPESPDWLSQPAVARLTVTSPKEEAAFASYNESLPYTARVRPWNFLLKARPAREQAAVARGLIGAFESNSRIWLTMRWFDRQNPGATFRIRVGDPVPADGAIAVETYGAYLEEFMLHPESKAMAQGERCHPWSRGLLQPRLVRASGIKRIGKEANRLAERPELDEHDTRPIVYEVPGHCSVCGEVLTSPRRRYCSAACKQKAYRARHR